MLLLHHKILLLSTRVNIPSSYKIPAYKHQLAQKEVYTMKLQIPIVCECDSVGIS